VIYYSDRNAAGRWNVV